MKPGSTYTENELGEKPSPPQQPSWFEEFVAIKFLPFFTNVVIPVMYTILLISIIWILVFILLLS